MVSEDEVPVILEARAWYNGSEEGAMTGPNDTSPLRGLSPAERAAVLSRMTREEKFAIREHLTWGERFLLDFEIVGGGLAALAALLLCGVALYWLVKYLLR
jgi:hypothetical protein